MGNGGEGGRRRGWEGRGCRYRAGKARVVGCTGRMDGVRWIQTREDGDEPRVQDTQMDAGCRRVLASGRSSVAAAREMHASAWRVLKREGKHGKVSHVWVSPSSTEAGAHPSTKRRFNEEDLPDRISSVPRARPEPTRFTCPPFLPLPSSIAALRTGGPVHAGGKGIRIECPPFLVSRQKGGSQGGNPSRVEPDLPLKASLPRTDRGRIRVRVRQHGPRRRLSISPFVSSYA